MELKNLFTREVGALLIAGALSSGCAGIAGLTKQEGQAGGAALGGGLGTQVCDDDLKVTCGVVGGILGGILGGAAADTKGHCDTVITINTDAHGNETRTETRRCPQRTPIPE